MKVQPITRTKKASRAWGRAAGLCLLAGVIVMVLVVWPGMRGGFAQTAVTPQAAVAQNTAEAGARVPEHETKQEVQASSSDERKKQIADESANLLSLANSLKAEVDKTTKDTLSVTVVREAGEIERLAHKMRTK